MKCNRTCKNNCMETWAEWSELLEEGKFPIYGQDSIPQDYPDSSCASNREVKSLGGLYFVLDVATKSHVLIGEVLKR